MVLAPTSLLEDGLFSKSCKVIDAGSKTTAASPRLARPTQGPTGGPDAQVTRTGDLQLAQANCPWPNIHIWLLYKLD